MAKRPKQVSVERVVREHDALVVALLVLLCLLVLLILYFTVQTHRQYDVLKAHRAYFREANQSIQPWMTVEVVIQHFNLTQEQVYGTLGVNGSIEPPRSTISAICAERRLNCTQAVAELNGLRGP